MERTQDFIFTENIQETDEALTEFGMTKQELIEKIRESEEEIKAGKYKTLEEFKAEMEERIKRYERNEGNYIFQI